MRLNNSIEEIYKFVIEALRSRGVVREIKTVEIHIEEFIEYFKSVSLRDWTGEMEPILFNMRRTGILLTR